MNEVVQRVRAKFPGDYDDLSDEELTLKIGRKFPGAYDDFEDFTAQFQSLSQKAEAGEAMRAAAGAELPSPGDLVGPGMAGRAGRSFAAGALRTAAGVPEALGIAADALGEALPMIDEGRPLEELASYQMGQALRRKADEVAPMLPSDIGPAEKFLTKTVPEAGGSAVAFMGGGAAGQLLKASPWAATAMLGAASGGAEGFQDARRHGADDEAAWKSFLINGGVGTSEAFPLAQMLERFDQASGGWLKRAVIEGSEEAAQEAIQTLSGNATAKALYDSNRELLDGAGESTAAGGTVGAILSVVTSALGGRRGGNGGTVRNSQTVDPDPVVLQEEDMFRPPPRGEVLTESVNTEDQFRDATEMIEEERAEPQPERVSEDVPETDFGNIEEEVSPAEPDESTIAEPEAEPGMITPGMQSTLRPGRADANDGNFPIWEVGTEEIAARPALMQFKEATDPVAGTNEQDKIRDPEWEPLQGGVLLLWEPADPAEYELGPGENYIVANGHHRLEFARRIGHPQMNVQIVREADGYSPSQVRALAAEINIKDGKGTIYDHAKFLRNQAATFGKDEALARARRLGLRGRKGANIGLLAGDSLYTSFRNEQVSPEVAEAIAVTAPGDEALQRAGLAAALKGKQGLELREYIKALASMRSQATGEQGDLFGADDSILADAEAQAKRAAAIQRQLKEKITAAQSAHKRPDAAREMGVDVKDQSATQQKLDALKAELARWESWPLHPDLVAQVRGDKSVPVAAPVSEPVVSASLPAATPAVSSPASRFRPRQAVFFENPLKGPKGKLVGYEWQWRPEESVDKRGEDVVRRVSDWEKAEASGETGRDIVHQFTVELKDGTQQTVSLEGVARVLGLTEAKAARSMGSKVKTLAKNKMKLAAARQQLEILQAAIAEVEQLPVPPVELVETREDGAEIYRVGDATTHQPLFQRKRENLKPGEIFRGQREALIDHWYRNRMSERAPGITESEYGLKRQIQDLERRIKKAEAGFVRDAPVEPAFSLEQQTPEDVARERTEAEAKAKEEAARERMLDQVDAPLLGDSSNVGQFTMIEGEGDLFTKADAKLKSLKIDTQGKMFDATVGLPIAVWNGAIEVMRLALKAGRSVAVAIDQAIAYLRSKGVPFDEQQVRQELGKEYHAMRPEAPEHVQGERHFPKQAERSGYVREDSPFVGDETRFYEVRTNEDMAAWANRIIDEVGPDRAEARYRDRQPEDPAVLRAALGIELIKRWGDAEQQADAAGDGQTAALMADRQGRLLADFAEETTEAAQYLQYLSTMNRATPAGVVNHFRRTVEATGRKRLARLKPVIDQVGAGLQEINEQGIREVAGDRNLQDGVRAAADESIAESEESREAIRQEAIEDVSETFRQFASVIADFFNGKLPGTLSKILQERFGLSKTEAERTAVKIHAEFANVQTIKRKRFQKRVAEVRQREAASAEAREDYIAQWMSVWDREKEGAAIRLAREAWPSARDQKENEGVDPGRRPAIEEFTRRLGTVLKGEVAKLTGADQFSQAKLRAEQARLNRLSDLEVLVEMLANREKYQQVWERAKERLQHALGEAEPGDAAVGLEMTRFFDAALPNVGGPYADKAILRQLRETGRKLSQVIVRHYTRVNETSADLVDELVAEAGLTGPSANRLAEIIHRRFSAMVAERKAKLIGQIESGKRGLGIKRKTLQKLVELSNLGALDSARIRERVAEDLNLPQFTDEDAAEVKRRAELIQTKPEGFQQQREQIRLLNYVEGLKDVAWHELPMAFWYSNILSGPTTHILNIASTTYNLGAHLTFLSLRNPREAFGIWTSALEGIRKAKDESISILATGEVTGTRLLKAAPARPLERQIQKGGANRLLLAWGWVGRALSAEDMLFYKAAEEAMMHVAARRVAKTEGLQGRSAEARAREILNRTDEARQAAQAQAAREGLTGRDFRRRVEEILERNRPADLREDARDYALQVTFNEQPSGFLGAVAAGINMVASQGIPVPGRNYRLKVPALRLIVPFTNVVANVTNETLAYFPVVGQALRGTLSGSKFGEPMTRDQVADEWSKAGAGFIAMVSVMTLAMRFWDDEDPPFMIYGSGPTQRGGLMETGWKPYSVKVGNSYIPYNDTPMAVPFSIVGNYLDGLRYRKFSEEGLLNRVAMALSTSASVITQRSFLSGVMDFFAALSRDPTPGSANRSIRATVRTGSAFVFPNSVKQIDRIFDPTRYDDESVEAAIITQIPFVRRSERPALNALGEPIESHPLTRFYSTGTIAEPWNTLATKQAWPSLPRQGDLSNDRYYELVRERGRILKASLVKERARIERMSPEDARKHVSTLSGRATVAAKAKLGIK